MEEIEAFRAGKDVSIVGFFGDADSSGYKAFVAMAEGEINSRYGVSLDENVGACIVGACVYPSFRCVENCFGRRKRTTLGRVYILQAQATREIMFYFFLSNLDE